MSELCEMRRNPPTTLGEVFEKKYKPVLDLLAKNPLFKQPDGKQKERVKENVAKAEVSTEVKTDRKPYVKGTCSILVDFMFYFIVE